MKNFMFFYIFTFETTNLRVAKTMLISLKFLYRKDFDIEALT